MTNQADARADWHHWAAVATLGIGSFAIVTAELMPIGLLSQIGNSLDRLPRQVGLIVTLYAWIAAGAALASTVILGRAPRRPLLIGLMIVLAVSAAASALANSFEAIMLARVIGAFAHGAFWAMIGTLGAQLVPARQVGLATSIIFGGVSVASVLGVPFANLIGMSLGWRMAFACTAVLAFAVAGAVWGTLPKLQGTGNVGADSLLRVLRNNRFQRIFVATILSITAHFMAFTYIEPFLGNGAHMPVGAIPVLLFAFGAAGLAANAMTGALIDRQLKTILVGSLMFAALALLALALFGTTLGIAGTAFALIVWGGSIAAVLVALQTWILKEAGEDALPASAIYVALFNASIGLGAIIGSTILGVGDVATVFLVAAICVALGTLAVIVLREPVVAPVERPSVLKYTDAL